jgi:hypothetical protein
MTIVAIRNEMATSRQRSTQTEVPAVPGGGGARTKRPDDRRLPFGNHLANFHPQD